MKKSLIALCVATGMASAANASVVYEQDGTKVSLYGTVRVLLAKQENNRWDLLNDQSKFWLNIDQNIGGDLTAFAAMQVRPQTKYDDNFSDGFYTHRMYAGVRLNDVGELSFGNQSTTGNAFKTADFTKKFGGITPSGVKNPGTETYRTYGRVQYGLKTSAQKVIHFKSAQFNGFIFSADYILSDKAAREETYFDKKQNKNVTRKLDNKSGYQFGMFYYKRIDSFTVKTNAVYGQQKIKDGFKARSVGLGLGFAYRNLQLGLDYLHDKNLKTYTNDDSQTSWQFGWKYNISYPWAVYGAYRQTKYTDNTKNRGFALGAEYRITRNLETFVEYDTNKATNIATYKDRKTQEIVQAYPSERQNGYYAGLRFSF